MEGVGVLVLGYALGDCHMSSRQNGCEAIPRDCVSIPTPRPYRVVTDIPPMVHALGKATCRTPDQLLANRTHFGNPTYAVEGCSDETTWYFSNDLQDAVALGLKWVERGCALRQIPEEQDGEVVYAYSVSGLEEDADLEYTLYSHRLFLLNCEVI